MRLKVPDKEEIKADPNVEGHLLIECLRSLYIQGIIVVMVDLSMILLETHAYTHTTHTSVLPLPHRLSR